MIVVKEHDMDTISSQVETDTAAPQISASELVEEDSLVEEISIDGMCGVY